MGTILNIKSDPIFFYAKNTLSPLLKDFNNLIYNYVDMADIAERIAAAKKQVSSPRIMLFSFASHRLPLVALSIG